jgi:hypothetical protein
MANAPRHDPDDRYCGGTIYAAYVKKDNVLRRIGSFCDTCKTFSTQPLVAKPLRKRSGYWKHPERVSNNPGRDFAPPAPPEPEPEPDPADQEIIERLSRLTQREVRIRAGR